MTGVVRDLGVAMLAASGQIALAVDAHGWLI